MMRIRLSLLLLSLAAACGGESGPSGDGGGGGVTVQIQKPAGSGDAQSGPIQDTLPAPIVVLVTEDGTPAAGRVVNFAAVAGSGIVIPTVDTTGVDGRASAIWILGNTAGVRQARATSAGAVGSPLTFTATAQAGTPVAMALDGGDVQDQETGLPFAQALAIRITDLFGNRVPNVVVTWAVTAGSATLSAPLDTTGNDGRSTVIVQAGGTPGAVTVTASVATLDGSPLEFSLLVTPISTHVNVSSNFFASDTVDIPVGGAVKWFWVNGTHNVTQVGGPATFGPSPSQSAGATYGPIVFDVAGVYTYECTLHANMTGIVRVGVASAPPPGVQR